ncbi:alpha-amlyase [Fulvivirga sp. M361]|uniref:alpha-amylase family glycosyl hydrolase n=1 Tax=Fulvivirga sp. M361 TaxID=2594266 RepID=UPI00117ADDC0|nr:alpha-amylase family glycosyl hydrolase [Fulvivirga sp. M361]TRX57571.1 alpha-amlyase [Fulvivirga sp. M361]
MRSKLFLLLFALGACTGTQKPNDETQTTTTTEEVKPFVWNNANIYFLLTDRFNNGDKANDQAFDRKPDGAKLRSFEGGDIKGITEKIKEGYFDKLGVTALWFTPVWEQVHGFTDEGTGKTYAYHGYWARDWTAIDPNFGTFMDLKEMVDTAHEHGIRVLLDVVVNHTGPVTDIDSQWPDDWVRVSPTCAFQDIETTTRCTLVENLPDIYTESDAPVELPAFLVDKWKEEGRLEQEMKELDTFFASTGLPKAPRFYIMKWIVDYVRELGIDGFRVDTAKHTEAEIWAELKELAVAAFEGWKKENPDKKLDDQPFFMMAEVYNYRLHSGQEFDMGKGEMVNFYQNGFESLINFAFKDDGHRSAEATFSEYSEILNTGNLKGYSVVNYVSSHDDGHPYDVNRDSTLVAGTKLLLAPGITQIYYGDETGRPLVVEGTKGDANLRSFMNWSELDAEATANGNNAEAIYEHWAKLGQFRKDHISVGAGIHEKIGDAPYTFKRTYSKDGLEDKVLVALDISADHLVIPVNGLFKDGTVLKEYYSEQEVTVKNGVVDISEPGRLVLLGES